MSEWKASGTCTQLGCESRSLFFATISSMSITVVKSGWNNRTGGRDLPLLNTNNVSEKDGCYHGPIIDEEGYEKAMDERARQRAQAGLVPLPRSPSERAITIKNQLPSAPSPPSYPHAPSHSSHSSIPWPPSRSSRSSRGSQRGSSRGGIQIENTGGRKVLTVTDHEGNRQVVPENPRGGWSLVDGDGMHSVVSSSNEPVFHPYHTVSRRDPRHPSGTEEGEEEKR